MYLGLGHQQADATACLDREVREVLLELEEALSGITYLELDGDLLSLAVGVGREVEDT